VKELLSREGVPFTAYNVDEDEHAYDELLARGWRTVPVTVIGESVLRGFNPVELADAIAAWRLKH
jgi:glutaredoxin